MEKDQPLTTGLSGGKISAFRDRQGRLVIRGTDEGQRISPGLPPGLALASLDPHISEAAQAYGLPIPLVLAVVKVESNFVPWAVSPKGAMGLMQLMPGTATFLGVRDPFNPRENLLGGCRYLRLLLDCFNGSLPLALAAYNAGYQRVIDAGFQIPPIKETQEFVTRILGIYYQSLNRALRPAGFT
jgi:soluble lytic murein transglycosylase-like protein